MARYYSRSTDKNQKVIVADLRKVPGFKVAIISRAGEGKPDLITKYRRICLVEVKMPGKTQTDDEREFEAYWGSDDYIVAETAEQILAWHGLMTGE